MNRWRLLGIVTPVVLVLDQATKLYIDARFDLYESVPVIKGWFHLTYIRNKGAAFGIFADSAVRIPFFIGVTIIALLVIVWYLRRVRVDQQLAAFSLALIFAGALGNLIDRVRLGEVIDFLDVFWRHYHWPAFNVADSAICVGVALLIWEMWQEERRIKRGKSDHIEEDQT
jgi:signal peptidase II